MNSAIPVTTKIVTEYVLAQQGTMRTTGTILLNLNVFPALLTAAIVMGTSAWRVMKVQYLTTEIVEHVALTSQHLQMESV